MINVTANYPTQTFFAPAQSQIITQVNNANTSNIPASPFPLTSSRVSSAGTAPDGSGAVMYQRDAMIGPSATYSYQNTGMAQSGVLEAAARVGHEYYIEISPIPATSYSILAWTAI